MTEFEEYQQTGMLGSYFPDRAHLQEAADGTVSAVFRDTAYLDRGGCRVHERDMMIAGRYFQICSVFPDTPTATPTDKLYSLIDAQMEKEIR